MLGSPCPNIVKSHLWGFLLLLKTFTIGGSIIYFTFAQTAINQTDEDVAEHFLNLQQFFGHTSNEIPANNMPANDLGLNGFADFVEASVELQTE